MGEEKKKMSIGKKVLIGVGIYFVVGVIAMAIASQTDAFKNAGETSAEIASQATTLEDGEIVALVVMCIVFCALIIALIVMALRKKNVEDEAKPKKSKAIAAGILIVILSVMVTPIHDVGFVGIVVGVIVLIGGIFAAAKQKTELPEENRAEYAETVRNQIIQNEQLTRTEIENLLAKYCKAKNLFGEAAAQEASALLRARGVYLDSDDALDSNYSVNLGYGLMMNVKVDKLPEDDEEGFGMEIPTEEIAPGRRTEYIESLRRSIVKDGTLSPGTLKKLMRDYCRLLRLPSIAEERTRIELLRERAHYLNPPNMQESEFQARANDSEDIADAAFENVMKNRAAAHGKNHYTIEYMSYTGDTTRREIDLQGFQEEPGKLYINAYCYLRQDMRQFAVWRIVRLFDADGKEIISPETYFEKMYRNTDEVKISQFFEFHADELDALVFLARSDGQMRKNERAVIAEFVQKSLSIENDSALDEKIKYYRCEFSQFKKSLKNLAQRSDDARETLVSFAEKIYNMKKSPDAMETATLQKIKELMK